MKRNFREIESRESDRTEIACEADSHTIDFLLQSRCASRGYTRQKRGIEATCSVYLLSGTSLVKPNTRRAEVRRDETTETPHDWRYECGSLAAMQFCYCLLYWPGLLHVVTEVTQ